MLVTKDTRKLLADKILDLSNIATGALIFGQFISEKSFSWQLVTIGMTLLIIGYLLSIVLSSQR